MKKRNKKTKFNYPVLVVDLAAGVAFNWINLARTGCLIFIDPRSHKSMNVNKLSQSCLYNQDIHALFWMVTLKCSSKKRMVTLKITLNIILTKSTFYTACKMASFTNTLSFFFFFLRKTRFHFYCLNFKNDI